MRIWHVGAAATPHQVDGVTTTVWMVAKEQARKGHEIGLIVNTPPDAGVLRVAREYRITLLHAPAGSWRFNPRILHGFLHTAPPDLVHLHSVFVPRQATLAVTLRRRQIPYVVTPHGGLAPQVLGRDRIKKILYGWAIQKQGIRLAAAVTAQTPRELEQIMDYVPGYTGIGRSIPGPVEATALESHGWSGTPVCGRHQAVFLGRFDVYHKGIDLVVNLARYLPEMDFHLYGAEDRRTKPQLEALMRDMPQNAHFHPPVYDEQKLAVLERASIYLQMSRWENFGISVAEAMYLGVPCVVSETHNVAEIMRQQDLGLVVPLDPGAAEHQIRAAIQNPTILRAWSERSRAFAREQFGASVIADAYLSLYDEVLHA